jgi:hypothetical protein
MNEGFIADTNTFIAKCLTESCLPHPIKGKVTLPEAMYDFSFNFADGGRNEYFRYGAMRELFNNAGEANVTMFQGENNEWNVKIPMKVNNGYAVASCAKGGCDEVELKGGQLSDEVYMKLKTRSYKVSGKYCLNDFKYLTPDNTMGDVRSPKDLATKMLSNIQEAVDHLRAFMFYSDGSAIISEIETVITGNIKFKSTNFRQVQWLQDKKVYGVYRPLAGTNPCLPPMEKTYLFMGWVEVVGEPDASENTFYIAASTTKVDGTIIAAPTLQAGDVFVPSQNEWTSSSTNTMWTPITAADQAGYRQYASCAVEGLFSLCNYVGSAEYRCISTELYPMFKSDCVSCCVSERGAGNCKPFQPQLIWNAVNKQQLRTRGKYGATVLMMNTLTYESIRQATLDDTRFTKFYSGGETINIGAEAFMVKYDNMRIIVDNNLPVGALIITAMGTFKRVSPVYGNGFHLNSPKLTFLPTSGFKTYGGVSLPDFFCIDAAGNAYVQATAMWEYEYANMIPSATTIIRDICTDFSGCADTCRAICG